MEWHMQIPSNIKKALMFFTVVVLVGGNFLKVQLTITCLAVLLYRDIGNANGEYLNSILHPQ